MVKIKFMAKNKFRLLAILGGIIVILVAIIVVQNLSGFGGLASLSSAISEQELEEKIVKIISQDIGDPDEVKVESIEKEGSLYKIAINVMGQDYESYATLDGKYLFPQKVDLNPAEPKQIPQTKKPNTKLFVMSYCSFGNQAEELMMPVAKLLNDKADIELHYIIYSDYATGYPEYCLDEEDKYCSMHGLQELNQGIRELCVQKYQKAKLWDFIKEMNAKSSSENADENWEEIAKSLDIDIEKIKTCQKEEAFDLLDKELAFTSKAYEVQNPTRHRNNEKELISGSPTLLINGMIYDGMRSTSSYQKAICGAFTEPPEACSQELQEEIVAPDGSCE